MDNESMINPLRVALAGYDSRELRVHKRYLEEEGTAIDCTCFKSGAQLLEVLRQDSSFDAVVLCGETTDLSVSEFLDKACAREQHPAFLVLEQTHLGGRPEQETKPRKGVLSIGQADLKTLLRELYRMPGQQGQQMERQCRELYASWGIQLPDVNAGYLTCAVSVVYNNSQKMAIRKEILQTVGQQFNVSVSAVDSGLRRMLDQLEAAPTEAWVAFKKENGFAEDKLTTGKLIYAVKNHLRRQKEH